MRTDRRIDGWMDKWIDTTQLRVVSRNSSTLPLNDKEFLCITHTVKHNYISPSTTVGIQLHVSALYVGHLQVVM